MGCDPRLRQVSFLVRLLLLLLVVCADSAGVPPAEPSALEDPGRKHRSYRARWVSCYDGDTCSFILHLGLGVRLSQTVRFYGIDTPELRGSSRQRGLEVRDFVIGVLSRAMEIELSVPQRRSCDGPLDDCDERGRYGRLLANVFVDGQSLNALLLSTGRATLY